MRNFGIGFVLSGAALALTACGGGGGGSGSAATAAPTQSSGTPAPITSGNGGVAVNPLSMEAVVSSWNLEEVIQVDGETGAINGRWATGSGPADVVVDKNTDLTFVANAVSQDITVIDRLANNTVTTIDVTQTSITGLSFLSFVDNLLEPLVRPTGLALTPNGTKLYSANLLNVTAIDAQTFTPTKSLIGLNSLNLSQLLSNPGTALTNFISSPVKGLGMAKVAANDNYALATCMITGNVMRINAATDSVVDYVDVGTAPIGITIAGTKAYVACAISQEIWVIDVNTGTVVNMIAAQGMIPVDVTTNEDGTMVYVANAISGDISVIDPALDAIVDTLPAGQSLTSIFNQFGLAVPSSNQGGWQGFLNNFLQGYTSGLGSPSSFGNLLFGGGSSSGGLGGLLSPGALVNGLITGFLGFAGLNSSQINGLNLPGIGIMSVGVCENPDYVCAANAFLGELAVTQSSTKGVSAVTGLTGLGPADVATIWNR